MKFILKLLLLIIFIIFFAYAFFYLINPVSLLAPSLGEGLEPRVCLKNNCFLVELAKTAEARSQGLAGRQSLEKDKGMLFIFEQEGTYPLWMKDALITLDIIWIDKDRKIVFINKNSQPCDTADCPIINPENKAKYVLEINAGICEKMGIRTGDYITLSGLAP